MPRTLLLSLMLMSPPSARAEETTAPPDAESRLKSLEDRLAKLEGAPAPVRQSAFNPGIGMAVDTVLRDSNSHANFDLRAAELNIAAPIDPFLTGWAVITAREDAVGLEEAAMQTTGLPGNLQVTGGRFFAPFGRFSQWHDHELPMADRPNSIFTFVGGEARADGFQVEYLLPTPFFMTADLVTANRLGADDSRTDDKTPQPFDRWTHMGRLHAYADLTDSTGLDLGLTSAWTPKSRFSPGGSAPVNDSWRTLSGVDLTFRYMPSSGGLYKGFVWGLEALQNVEPGFDPNNAAPLGRVRSYAGYSNIEAKLGRNLRGGGFVDLTELPSSPRYNSKTAAVYVSYEFTEFNRLRLQYSRVMNNFRDTLTGLPGTDFASNDLTGLHRGNLVMLQWTTVIGTHVHGFRGRWGT